jgi:glycosyltransferase involved in cell wall biosynthesis
MRYGLENKFVVLYAGAHGLSNDLGVVLEAAARLLPHSSIKIVLVGDGKEKPNLIRQAEALNLSNVLFLPPFSKQEMPQVLAAADACLAILKPLPLYKTVYPNKVFDYLAAGKPILLAIDGVIRQVVEEAEAGIFVQPGNPQALAEAVLSSQKTLNSAAKWEKKGVQLLSHTSNAPNKQHSSIKFWKNLPQPCHPPEVV